MTKEEELEQLRAENAALREKVADLEAQVQALQEYLAKNSHNSSLPPSSDRFVRQPKSLRKPSGKKPGGQKGHQGHYLALHENPDVVELHQVVQCEHCHADLRILGANEVERRQIIELPPKRLLVTEHRVEEKQCPHCLRLTRASFPDVLRAPVQYGATLQALALYLVQYQFLPYARVSELLKDLLGLALAPGTIHTLIQQCASSLEPVEKAIKMMLVQEPVLHQDETGLYVKGHCHWMHVSSTKALTYYGVHAKRGKEGIDAQGILTHFRGTSVHDGFQTYQMYFCNHALCNVHHLRELTFVEEELNQPWAGKMKDLLLSMKRTVDQARAEGKPCLDQFTQTLLRIRYQELIEEGYAANPHDPPPMKIPGRRRNRQSTARNLLNRLSERREQVLRFLHDFAVPFDNNQAERDIRMVKVQQKISGCFRSEKGAQAFCRIRGYLSTMRKQGHPLLAVLEQAMLGHPVFPAL